MKYSIGLASFVLSGVLCFVIFSLLSNWQISRVGYEPGQSNILIDAFIITTPIVMLVCGFIGYRLSKFHLTGRRISREVEKTEGF